MKNVKNQLLEVKELLKEGYVNDSMFILFEIIEEYGLELEGLKKETLDIEELIEEIEEELKDEIEVLEEKEEYISNIESYLVDYDFTACVGAIIETCNEYGLEYIYEDIVPHEYIEDMVKKELEEYGWERVACMLEGIRTDDEYYYVDGYGNLQIIDYGYLDTLLKDIVNDIYDI